MIAVKEAILCPAQGSTVALGYFDGVHIGHREVISAAVRAGKAEGLIPSVFTFCGELPVKEGATLLQTRAQRRRALEALGVEFAVCPDFEKIRDMEPAHFFQEILRDRLRARVLVCGFNYRFGAGGAGDIALLRTLCEGAGIRLIALPPVEWGGELISSTRIRGALREGRPEEAAAMLGGPFTIEGEVIHGRRLGRNLGWPTINQAVPEGFTVPKFGVYHTRVRVDGRDYKGVTNVGIKPTVGGEHLSCETHILNFTGDLYGKILPVSFLSFLRPERRFDSVEELAAQVEQNIQTVRESSLL